MVWSGQGSLTELCHGPRGLRGHFVTPWFEAHHDRSIAKWKIRGADASVLVGHVLSDAQYADDGKGSRSSIFSFVGYCP